MKVKFSKKVEVIIIPNNNNGTSVKESILEEKHFKLKKLLNPEILKLFKKNKVNYLGPILLDKNTLKFDKNLFNQPGIISLHYNQRSNEVYSQKPNEVYSQSTEFLVNKDKEIEWLSPKQNINKEIFKKINEIKKVVISKVPSKQFALILILLGSPSPLEFSKVSNDKINQLKKQIKSK